MPNFFIGKEIIDIKIADDDKALLFKCDDGEHVVRVDGDCCSDSWIENIELPFRGFPAKVLSFEDLEMPDDEDKDGEVIAFYGCKLATDKGDIVIDYRNSSNGYYGGNLTWPDDSYYYGGVYDQNRSTENWIDIKEK